MYLVELDPVTGLVRVDGEFDGVRAIKEFREIINDEKLGVECFTAIALTVDYLTPIQFYKNEDRPFKAMEIATGGNRKAFVWNQEKIQQALITYDELQYNPTIEEKRTLDSMLLNKLKEIQDEKDEMKRMDLFKQLNTIKDLIKAFNNANEEKDIYSEGIVRNGYHLTRLEIKAMDKNSFYHKRQKYE